MAEIVNLRQARKRKIRAEKVQTGVENRAKFGRTKGEKQRDSLTARQDRRRLEEAKIPSDD